MAQLNHPHIIQIYTIGTLPGGRPYLAMPYIDGGTLQEHLTQTGQQKQPLPALRALTLARQIASALQAAHLAGIILYELLAGTHPLRRQRPPGRRTLTCPTLAGPYRRLLNDPNEWRAIQEK